MKKRRVSYSQIDQFNQCGRKYKLSYVDGIVPASEVSKPVTLGGLIHVGLAAAMREYYTNSQLSLEYVTSIVRDAMISKWREGRLAEGRPTDTLTLKYPSGLTTTSVPEVVAEAIQIVQHTLSNLDMSNKSILSAQVKRGRTTSFEPMVEFPLEVKIPKTAFYFVGFVDVVWFDRETQLVELVDWKTTSRIERPEVRELDMQLPIYQHALQQMGIDVSHSVLYQIRSAIPAIPGLNKNGTMARTKITTTWEVYRQALIDNNLNPDDYEEDMRPKLDENVFFAPIAYYFSQEITQRYWDNMLETFKAIRRSKRYPYTGVYGFPCRSCWYHDLCFAELHGHDVENMIGEGERYVYKERK